MSGRDLLGRRGCSISRRFQIRAHPAHPHVAAYWQAERLQAKFLLQIKRRITLVERADIAACSGLLYPLQNPHSLAAIDVECLDECVVVDLRPGRGEAILQPAIPKARRERGEARELFG